MWKLLQNNDSELWSYLDLFLKSFPPRTSPNMRSTPVFASWDQAKPAAEPKKGNCASKGCTAKNASAGAGPAAPLSPDPGELHIPPSALLLGTGHLNSILHPREVTKSSLSLMQGEKGPYCTQTSQNPAVLPGRHQSADLSPQKYHFNTNFSIGSTDFPLQFFRVGVARLWSRRCLAVQPLKPHSEARETQGAFWAFVKQRSGITAFFLSTTLWCVWEKVLF